MRTDYEKAVERGMFPRHQIEALLAKYGLPMTPPSRVFKGQEPKAVARPTLFKSEL